MADFDEARLAAAVDRILEHRWRSERRRARTRRLAGGAGRAGALVVAVAGLSLLLGLRLAAPELAFFALLGLLGALSPAGGHRWPDGSGHGPRPGP